MNTLNLVSTKVRLAAVIASIMAMICMTGGSLGLAEHYAQAGATGQAAINRLAGEPMHHESRHA